MEQQQRQQIKKYVDLVLRRKKMIISFVMIGIFIGLGLYLKTPKVYESTALLMYQQAKINPGSKLTPNVKTKTREIIATLTQQVTSRSSLEAFIKQFDLYQKMRKRLPMEDVVDLMRSNNIVIKPDRGDVFRVSFQGVNPKKVMQVANAIAAKFIEENLRYREEKATETSAYATDEMNIAKVTLDKKEGAMRDYKLKYYNEMPQQFDTNMTRLNALQDQLQKNQDSGQNIERTKVLIQEQINIRKSLLRQMASQGMAMAAVTGGQDVADSPLAASMAEINKVKAALDTLRLRYTEKHPEVRHLKKKLKELQDKQVELAKKMPETEQVKSDGSIEVDKYPRDKQLVQLDLQLKDLNYNIKRLKKAAAEIEAQTKLYQQWIDKTPVREAEWTALTRDYKQLYNHFQQLVVRNLEADSAESLERRQKGSQFKIVDSAYFPEKPIEPNFKKIMLLALALGLGLGGGLAFVLEMGDASFRDPEDLETYLGLPVICSLPQAYLPQEQRRQRWQTMARSAVLALSMVVLLAGLIYFYKSGRIVL